MILQRRERATYRERFRLWLWPRVSWRRSGTYYAKRVLRLSGTPYAIAMGCAVGAFASFMPLVGVHCLLTFAIAWILRANLLAGAIGTLIGNPLTFPFIWAGNYELGQMLLGRSNPVAPHQLGQQFASRSLEQIWPLVKPMTLGAIPLGLATGCMIYFLVYNAVAAYQDARRERFADRRATGAVRGEAALASQPGRSA